MGSPVPPRARVMPLSPQRYALQVTVSQATHDKLCRAQDLLGHKVASNDITEVLDRALDLLVAQLERAKFAATERPRRNRRRPADGSRVIARADRE